MIKIEAVTKLAKELAELLADSGNDWSKVIYSTLENNSSDSKKLIHEMYDWLAGNTLFQGRNLSSSVLNKSLLPHNDEKEFLTQSTFLDFSWIVLFFAEQEQMPINSENFLIKSASNLSKLLTGLYSTSTVLAWSEKIDTAIKDLPNNQLETLNLMQSWIEENNEESLDRSVNFKIFWFTHGTVNRNNHSSLEAQKLRTALEIFKLNLSLRINAVTVGNVK